MTSKLGAAAVGLGLLLALSACPKDGGGGSGGSVSAPIEGKWQVFNEKGTKTGQTVTITANKITMTTPNLSPTKGKATFSKKGDTIVADWYGAKQTFKVVDKDHVVMKKGAGVTWKLTRIK